ncbi:hypothetical protein TNCV_3137831 [Trichonephila clavipes]|nr:hypothetical protein TNCV_3137831 [Trichonephila clavipes]
MALGGSLPQINLGVQGVTQGGHHTLNLSRLKVLPMAWCGSLERGSTQMPWFEITRAFDNSSRVALESDVNKHLLKVIENCNEIELFLY